MPPADTSTDPGPRLRLAAGLNRFAYRLFHQLCLDQPVGNLFLSPSSIAFCLAMTHLGAAGTTKDELAKLLDYTLPDDKRRKAFRDLQQATKFGGVDFRSANRLWGQSSYHFFSEFLEAVRQDFGAPLASLDFVNSPEAARQEINAWVEEQTGNRIRDLLPLGCINEMTRLVLTSAVHFLGSWDEEFDEKATQPAAFHGRDGSVSEVPMMHQTGVFGYAESVQLQLLQLSYLSRDCSVCLSESLDDIHAHARAMQEGASSFALEVLLPKQPADSSLVAKQLLENGIPSIRGDTAYEVRVFLPKFRVESSFFLVEALQSLGLNAAYSDELADFSAASDDPEGMKISEVIHKAFVDVNEKGTEAAAASAVMLAGIGGYIPPQPVEFRADHPFVFQIRDTFTGLVHFIGRFEGPAAD